VVSQPIIFTDLDGTLLDRDTYSFAAAVPALQLVEQKQIPLVFCSSKTRAEILCWRERLGNHDPFISENGGGIFVPISSFAEDDIRSLWPNAEMIDGYFLLVLGKPYPILRKTMKDLQRKGFEAKGFGDMSAQEVAQLMKLTLEEAELAKRREFDEPFVYYGDRRKISALLSSIREKGLRCEQGRLYHLIGDHDKGEAVEALKQCYQLKFGSIVTIGLGDSLGDVSMLKKVDYPILVQDHRGEHDRRIALPNLTKAESIGPEGWDKAVLKLIREVF